MATFEYDGRQVTVLPQHEVELGDLAFIKDQFGISGLVELEAGMADMDPTAWRAILIASIRRTDQAVSPTTGGIDKVAILPIIEKLNEERAERLAQADEEDGKAARPTTGRSSTRGRSGGR